MKVAILSMQEVKNYGSFLQAWSLKHTIESLGHTCDFINIIPGKQIGDFKQKQFALVNIIADRLIGNGNPIMRIYENIKFRNNFNNVYFHLLGVKPGFVNTERYDVVVIGSDEVFNCAQKTWFGFSRQLFGEGLNSDKVITYAACFGATNITVLTQLGIKDEIGYLLNKINSISVRDVNSLEATKELTGKEPFVHLDPVFIYDYSGVMPKSVKHQNYMMVYAYPNRIQDPKEIKAICDYARKNNLKILSQNYFPWVDEVIIVSPFEMLAYFRDASCVVTDTFHGTVFSIKHNKAFCTIVRGLNNNKLSDLLSRFDLNSHIANDTHSLEAILDTPIDYKFANQLICQETVKSIDYLKSNIL